MDVNLLSVDLFDMAYDARFAGAPLYRKDALVRAVRVTEAEHVRTVLANGLVETAHTALPGDVIITNPGGERYVVSATKFAMRYVVTGKPGVFQAVGLVRAFMNPTGVPVVIQAPWGKAQVGAGDCMFGASVEVPTDRYIIGAAEFADTYVRL